MGFGESGTTDYTRYQEYGIYIEKGIANAANNMELFLNIMEMFIQDKERRVQLKQFIADGNTGGYGIQVHALKGEARTLGADILADVAYEHEKQSKAGNLAYVEEHWNELVECWDETLSCLEEFYRESGRGQAGSSVAAAPAAEADSGTIQVAPEEMAEVVSLLADYDSFKAVAKMRKWLKQPLKPEQRTLIESAIKAVEREYDEDKAIAILTEK